VPTVKRASAIAVSIEHPRVRTGVTLAELVVVLVLIGLVGSMIGLTLVRQQRFYRGTTDLLQAREGVRDAMELLSADIRGMSAADTVRLLADSAIELFANAGSSVVCARLGGTAVGLPGLSAGRGNALTAFLTLPDTGDIAIFHRDSVDGVTEWERHRIVAFAGRSLATTSPASSGFARQVEIDAGGTGLFLELSTPLSAHVDVGAPVRFLRRGRYSLYRASDGDWYLGYRRCNAVGASTCGAIQPLSGPYRDYSSDPGGTGLLFEYFNKMGGKLAPDESPLAIARVDITARAESKQRINVEGRVNIPSDSATVAIAIRNRAP
jgi:type II secretory pathway pseudopilin PulG